MRATSGLLVTWGPTALLPILANGTPRGWAFNRDRRSPGVYPDIVATDADGAPTVPYVGLGYGGVSMSGSWGFSAEIGIVISGPRSSTKLGRADGGIQAGAERPQRMRLSPLVQMSISNSF